MGRLNATNSSTQMNRLAKIREPIILLFAFAAQLAWLAPMSAQRLVARDEGFYALAARLVFDGKLPYLDFFYTQTPLLPYVYGAVLAVFGKEWIFARLTSAVLTALVGTLLFHMVHRQARSLAWAGLALFLFLSNSMILAWYLTVQTYALSSLLLLLTIYLVQHAEEASSPALHLVLAGVTLGAACLTRLFFAGLIPCFLLYFWLNSTYHKRWLPCSLRLMFGIGLGLLPLLALFVADPAATWFNNMGYHLARSQMGFLESLPSKGVILKVLTGFRLSRKSAGVQIPVVFYLGLISTIYCLYRRQWNLVMLCAWCLLVLNFIPTPAYVQYYCTVIPLFLLLSLSAAKPLWEWFTQHRLRSIKATAYTALIALVLVYVRSTPGDLRRYTVTGKGVPGIGQSKDPADFTLSRIRRLSRPIEDYAEGRSVFALWPGHLLESNALPYPGSENHFARLIGDRISPQERERYYIMSEADLIQGVSQAKIPVLVITDRARRKKLRKALISGNYQRVEKLGSTEIHIQIGSAPTPAQP